MPNIIRGLSDAHYIAIGRVAVEWSYLEWIVEDSIHVFAALDDPVGRMVTTHMSLDKRMDALVSLVRALMPDTEHEREIIDINKIIRRERNGEPSLESQRNRIIHCHWEWQHPEVDFAQSIFFRSRGNLTMIQRSMTAEDVNQLADRICEVGDRLWRWYCSVEPLKASLRRKHRKLKFGPAPRPSPQKRTKPHTPPRPPQASRAKPVPRQKRQPVRSQDKS